MRAGYQAMLALDVMAMAVSPNPPQASSAERPSHSFAVRAFCLTITAYRPHFMFADFKFALRVPRTSPPSFSFS